MNLKAKTVWRRSGERLEPALALPELPGFPRASCSSLPSVTWLFLQWFCPVPTLLGSPFPQRIPTPQLQ